MRCTVCRADNSSGTKVCVSCGTSLSNTLAPNDGDAQTLTLPRGVGLQNGTFKVASVLGQGGFGITYKGGDMRLKRYVAIKEFFPQGCQRSTLLVQPTSGITQADYGSARTKFLEEARTLARFNHPGIVRVFSTFEENNTAYMVMELLEGHSLGELLDKKGVLSEKEAVGYIENIAEALTAVHSVNMIHRDIKPDNIIITDSGRAVLIDFGTARAFASNKTVRQTAMLTPGYAPLEQYGQQARFGPYTDVYALAATLYHCLTGQPPPPATDRATGVELQPPDRVNPNLSPDVSRAVMWAMEVKADARPQTTELLVEALRGHKQESSSRVPGSVSPADLWVRADSISDVVTNASTQQIFNAVRITLMNKKMRNIVQNRNLMQIQALNSDSDRVVIHIYPETDGTTISITSGLRPSTMKGVTKEIMRNLRVRSASNSLGGSAYTGPRTSLSTSQAPSGSSLYPASPFPITPQQSGSSTGWHYTFAGSTHGPVEQSMIPGLIMAGHVDQDTMVWREGMPDWTQARLTELNNLFSKESSYPPPPPTSPRHLPLSNGSGQGETSSPLPADLKGFNWGAFLFGWLWGVAHGAPWALVLLVLSFIPKINYLVLPISIALGFLGNELAWKNRKWDSIKQFRTVQRAWVIWGVGALIMTVFIYSRIVIAEADFIESLQG